MKIPALVLEWLELKIAHVAEERLRVTRETSEPGYATDILDTRLMAYQDLLDKLQELS